MPDPGKTHWEGAPPYYDGCWREHHECAVAEVERLQRALEWATKQLGHASELSTAVEWCEAHMRLISHVEIEEENDG